MDDLDAWVAANQPFQSFFLNLDFNIEANDFRREPQRDGYLRVIEHFRAGKNNAIVQIPVGCGKTGLAALLPLGIAEGRVIVIAPIFIVSSPRFSCVAAVRPEFCLHLAAMRKTIFSELE